MTVMNVRHFIPATVVSGAVALGFVALCACSGSSSAVDRHDGKLDVAASFYPLQYLTQQIGGGHVSVTNLTKPGVEPHDLELSPKQTVALSGVDAIVYLKGLQPAVDEAIKQSGVKYAADAASMTPLEKHGTEVDGRHTTGSNDSHAQNEAGADPHVWLDPVRYAQIAEGVGKAFEKADPDHAADYKANTAALVKKLGDLNTEFDEGLAHTRTKVFVTTHAAFGYLAERYGLTEEAISGIDPESEPSISRMKDLHALAAEHHVSTVFFETITDPDTAKTLAGDLHVRTDVLDPLEGITAKSKGDDYIEVMQSNLVALQRALGAK
jgi:zinc transport system substrate-binding protein